MRHTFNFNGGEELTTMGATWFVSYSYYLYVDNKHLNWNQVSTSDSRKSVFSRTGYYHKFWLQEILKMNDKNLNKNSIGLDAWEIKDMAKKVLAVFNK